MELPAPGALALKRVSVVKASPRGVQRMEGGVEPAMNVPGTGA